PAVSVPWFNVVTGETEYARLPARTISVAAGAATQAVPATTAPVETIEPASEPIPEQTAPTTLSPQQPVYWSVSSTVLLVLWLLTLLFWWYSRRHPADSPQPQDKPASVSSKHVRQA